MGLWQRLRRQLRQRRVLPLLGIFLASGFLVLEGVDQLIGHGMLPEFMYSIAIVFYVFGIPGTILIAWFHGREGPQKPQAIEFWMHGFMLIGALGISYGLFSSQGSFVDEETVPSPAPFGQADRIAIEEVLDGYSRALRNGDWAAAAEYASVDAVWVPTNEPPELGRRRVFNWVLEAPLPAVGNHRFYIHRLSGVGDLAYVHGRCDHGTEAESSFFLMILRKQAEGLWRINVEMWGDQPVIGLTTEG